MYVILHWDKIESSSPKDVPSLVGIGTVILEILKKIVNVLFSLFRNYLPLERGVALHLNKHDSP